MMTFASNQDSSLCSLQKRALAMLMLLPSAAAFTTNLSVSRLGRVSATGTRRTIALAAAPKYDLGLGKNPPLVDSQHNNNINGNTNTNNHDEDPYEMTKYCTEFSSVNELPNPSQRLRQAMPSAAAPAAAAQQQKENTASLKNPKPWVFPRRFNDEDFLIRFDNSSQEQSSPVMTLESKNHFDVNTAWVEMLIHDQQQQKRKFA